MSWFKINWKFYLRLLLGVFFIFAGVMHFLEPRDYLKIMPPWIPFHLQMVLISGFFESNFGLMVLFEQTRRVAGWGLIALLIAVFPANIYMALHPEIFPAVPQAVLWGRLPLQLVFIAWVWAVCLKNREFD